MLQHLSGPRATSWRPDIAAWGGPGANTGVSTPSLAATRSVKSPLRSCSTALVLQPLRWPGGQAPGDRAQHLALARAEDGQRVRPASTPERNRDDGRVDARLVLDEPLQAGPEAGHGSRWPPLQICGRRRVYRVVMLTA